MSIKELDPIEKAFKALDSANTFQNIAIISELDSVVSEQELRDKIQKISPDYPRLKQIMKGSYWIEKKEMDIQKNIEIKNFNTEIDYQELSNQLGSDIKIKDQFWKVVLYNCEKGKSYLATIFHHSFTDGLGMIEFNKDLFGEKKTKEKSFFKDKTVKKNLSYFRSAFLIIKDLITPKAKSNLNGINSNIRKFNFIKLDLNKINEDRKIKKLSLHEYMLTVFIKALKSKTNNFSILTPISHRHPKSSFTFGNYITGMPIHFSLDNFTVRNENLNNLSQYVSKKFRNEIRSKKNQAYISLSKLLAIMPKSLRKIFCDFTARKTHFICTSIPSIKNSILELGGAKVLAQYPVAALMKGHGIALGYTRFNNQVNICLISDPNIVNEPEDIINNIKIAANA